MLDGRTSLITPEGISLSFTPAGPCLRAVAWVLDLLIWFTAITVVVIVLNLLVHTEKISQAVYLLLFFSANWGYPILFEVYGGGRTLGKRIVGLEVIRADGLPVGWRESAIRNLLITADFLPVLFFTGLVSMLLDKQFRRLGDLVADTLVIYHAAPRKRSTHTADVPAAVPFPLSPEQQRTLLDFLDRADKLPYARRIELADIAEPLTGLRGEPSLRRLRSFAAGLIGTNA